MVNVFLWIIRFLIDKSVEMEYSIGAQQKFAFDGAARSRAGRYVPERAKMVG